MIALPDGRVAELVRTARAGGPLVVISRPNGKDLGTLTLEQPSARHHCWTYLLVPNGEHPKFVVIDGRHGGDAWVYAFSGKRFATYRAER
ncbi:hypothetical protein [Streptomyces sp. NPDC002133]|uniref:hypothetical protein n=1 Tax=Streptomyces sp. NPDC002133 TaxID=3154409 RepID=UPI00332EE973